MNEAPESFWTSPFGDWWLRLAWFAAVAVLAGFIAADLAEELPRIIPLAALIAGGLLFLAALARWLCCWRNFKKVLLVDLMGHAFPGLAPWVVRVICWRNAKKSLLAAAALVVLAGLVRTEEDWRGQRAWYLFKHAQTARGLRFDVASLAPPAVPEEQNFALSPIVASCYGRILDRHGAVKGMTAPSPGVVNRMNMAPDDGHPPKHALGCWETGELSNLETLQKYYRDLADQTNRFPVPSEPRSPAQDVLLALSKYDAALEELRQAARRPGARFPVDYTAADPTSIALPHLRAGKRCVQVLRLRSLAELQAGQSDQALADVLLALRLGESFRTEPLFISQLVRLAAFNLTLQPIYEGLAQHRWSDAQLETLSVQLAGLDFLADYHVAMRGELAFATSAIDYLRQHREIKFVGDSFTTARASSKFLSRVLTPDGFFFQNELAVARLHLRWSFPIIDTQRRLVNPTRASQKGAAQEVGHFSPYRKFARLIFPLYGKTVTRFAVGESNADLARVAVALERYRLAYGEYPDTLAPLAPRFLSSVPHDIMAGRPLHYRREPDHRFTLYSVGWNQTDEGGRVVLDKTGESANKDEGDWVWQYPERT